MSFWSFLLEAALISLSGVMAPGPVTTVTIGKGSKSSHAGALVAIGHGIVELPLMLLMFYGLGNLVQGRGAQAVIALLGGLGLVWLGVDMLRSVREVDASPREDTHSPMLAGLLLSLGNPYFLVWWATVGAALISRSLQFGWAGFLAFALVHWSCDLLWSDFLSWLAFRGGQFFGQRFQKGAFALCGAFLLLFSARSILDALRWIAA
jgi:threonine/homoserine/homoserine lactone efflux protein